jgi:excisionase family DNA binding protein
VNGRIVLQLDPGLGWTKPLVVAYCGVCGTELARHSNQDRAIRAARRRRCPGCGTRTARRLPGPPAWPPTSPWPGAGTSLAAAAGRLSATSPAPDAMEGGESRMPASPRRWLTGSQAAKQLQVSPKTVARWASQGRLAHRRTLGGHRRYDPELIDQLVQALTHRP